MALAQGATGRNSATRGVWRLVGGVSAIGGKDRGRTVREVVQCWKDFFGGGSHETQRCSMKLDEIGLGRSMQANYMHGWFGKAFKPDSQS